MNLSQDKYAIYGLIFKSEDGGTIHSINFIAKSITWKFFRDEKMAEKIALRVSNELDKRRDKKKVEQPAEDQPKKTPSEAAIKEVAGVDKENNTQTKKMNIETVTFKTYDICENPLGTIEAVKQEEEVGVMVFNKDIVKLSMIYIVVTVLFCLVDFGGYTSGIFGSTYPAGLNKLALSLGLKTWGQLTPENYPTLQPNMFGALIYLIMGVAVAFGLSYIYPNFTLKRKDKDDNVRK